MCRMRTLFIACLLAVSAAADESGCDCSSESAKAATLTSQVKKLEGELDGSKSGSKQVEQQLGALKTSSQKTEADLQKKVKDLEGSHASSGKESEKQLNDLKTNSQKTEADLQKKVKDLEASKASSQKAEADLQKKVKDLEGSHASSGKESEKQLNDLKTSSQKTEAELRSQIKTFSEKLEKANGDAALALQERGEHQRISVMGFASKVSSMTNGVVKHALDQTDLDDNLGLQVSAHVVRAKGAAGQMASNIKDRITSVNYTDVMQSVSSSEAYLKVSEKVAEKTQSLRPHLDKARVHLEPALAKAHGLAGPAWAKAQPTLVKAKTAAGPAWAKAVETYVAGAAAVQTHVLPVLKRGGSSALEQASAACLAQLDKVMTPVFDAMAKAVPDQVETLPTHPVDRVLFLVVVVVLAYYSLYFFRVALRIVLRLTMRTSWMSVKLFRLIVMIPLRMALYLIDCLWWVATLFYCCGLCRRSKKAGKLAAKAKKEEKKSGDKVETVTVAECMALFEATKKKNKVEEGAQQLAKFVKDKKPMKATSVQGKILTKEVFVQTCKKFNVNVKSLGL